MSSHQADGHPAGAFNSPVAGASLLAAVVLLTLVLGGHQGESVRFHFGYMLGASVVPALLTLPTFLIWRFVVNKDARQTKAASFNTVAVIFAAMCALTAVLKTTVPAWANAEIARMESKASTQNARNPFDRSGSEASERDLQPWEMDWGSATTREEAKVSTVYPEWRETVNSQAFKRWYEEQTADVRALADSPRAVDAIALIWHFERRAGGASEAKPAP